MPQIWAKFRRAQQHAEEFYGLLGGHVGPIKRPNGGAISYDRKKRQFELSATAPFPPDQLAIVLGDMIHQLRSALDHLAYGLVLSSKKQPTKDQRGAIAFPICDAKGDFATHRASQALAGLLPRAQYSAIRACQPFARKPKAPKLNGLSVLNKLDIIDKHRSVLVLRHEALLAKPTRRKVTQKYLVDGTTEHFFFTFEPGISPKRMNLQPLEVRTVIREPQKEVEMPVRQAVQAMFGEVSRVLFRFQRMILGSKTALSDHYDK